MANKEIRNDTFKELELETVHIEKRKHVTETIYTSKCIACVETVEFVSCDYERCSDFHLKLHKKLCSMLVKNIAAIRAVENENV